MPSRRAVSPSTMLIAVTLVVGTFVYTPSPLAAQGSQRAIDRWLVTYTGPLVAGESPLEIDGATLFPDRDLTVGPGYWRLLREDGQIEFELDGSGDRPASATTTLAHAYIKAPYDLTVDLGVDGPACASTNVWVNGQAVPAAESSEDSPVRLAAGWNALLVALGGDGGCAHRLGVTLSQTASPIRDDDEPVDFEQVWVQASRPPGVRPNQPNGALVLQSPIPVGLTWHAGTDELLASVSYTVSSWGGVVGKGRLRLEDGDDIPEGPPTVDLTGDWVITLYTPTGIMTSRTTLEMAEDGALTGHLQGERLEGDIRDGWVHGDEFGWRMRFEGRGRDLDVGIRGILTDDVMSGTLDFGGFRDFEARFEGERAPADGEGAEADGEAGDESADTGQTEDPETTESSDHDVAEPPPPDPQADVPQIPAPGDVDPAERERDELAAPDDPDGQRARIRRQLLAPPERSPDPAPASGSIELSIGGQKLTGSFEGLEPLWPSTLTGEVEFDRLRKAALDENGVEARLLWQGESHDFVGSVSAAKLLIAVHRPIRLDGWGLAGADGFAGAFRVPDALDGFTLRVGEGEWRVEGAPLSGDILCQPCDGGSRLELAVTGTQTPLVEIVDPGYDVARDGTDVPDANTWLEALRGNNDAYRELGRRFGSVERD
ncbi:MAG: hypothetical protein ACC682_04755 [Gemmatimonadota bacterium]